VMNKHVDDTEKVVYYLNFVWNHYEKNNFPRDPTYLLILEALSTGYKELENYDSAIITAQKECEGNLEIYGYQSLKYLRSLNKLSSIFSDAGYFKNELEVSLKAVELSKVILGEKNSEYLTSLNNLSAAYYNIGYNQSAIDIMKNVVNLREEIFGEKSEEYLIELYNLHSAYSSIGEDLKGLEIIIKATELAKEIYGDNHQEYLVYLSQLAITYSTLGDLKKANEIIQNIIKLNETITNNDDEAFYQIQSATASIYTDNEDYKKSFDIYFKLIEIDKNLLGENHPRYINSLSNLANLYWLCGENQKALEINKKVLELRKNLLGEKHPLYFLSLNNLAMSYDALGDYQKALEVSRNAVEFGKEILGDKHSDYISTLKNLAYLELDAGEFVFAINHFIQSLNLSQEKIIGYFTQLTEYQRKQFWNHNAKSFDNYPLFLEKIESPQSEEINYSYNIALFTKGLLLSTTLDFNQLLDEKGTSEAIEKYKDLKLLKLQIERINEMPLSGRNMDVDSLETIAQKLETDLIKLSKDYGDYTQNLKITWEEVQSNLGEKEVAVEFLEYPTRTDTVKYAALVLRRGWNNPKFVPLFRKDQIEEIVNLNPNQIYSNGFIGKELKKLVWDPLEDFITPGDRVHFSAAGILHQLAIENLTYDGSSTLGDRYQMYRLSSTKELALQKPKNKNQNVALYGGIKYDLEMKEMIVENKKYERKNEFVALRAISQDTTVRKGWQFLNGTLEEAVQVSRILNKNNYQVSEFIGGLGSEESFKDLSGKKPGIIHIATHGFFLPIEQSKHNPFIQMRFDDRNGNAGYVDPMLRSGLLLAGGNRAWQGDSIPETIEDGVLTAKEISHLDLRETDLVVLSACETGLGDISSEGVFGLQRAFKQAGAQTIIMSLWNVNDEATQYLMTNFYSYLTQGVSKREAFIQARNKCREQYQDPSSWAAFIMLD
jgi:CHAT domain-containing protein/tetratricopeptide (TPR) repeat protein